MADSQLKLDVPPTSDPLGCFTRLPIRQAMYPLGFPAVVETNSDAVLLCLRRSWGLFKRSFDRQPIHLKVVVSPDDDGAPHRAPVFRCRDHVTTVFSSPSSLGTADTKSGYACAWITERMAEDWNYLRDGFTDALLLFMLHAAHLSAVHAACVVYQGAGLLLCGESGAGKSALALGCALRGWSLVSDDVTFLIRKREDRVVIGNPYLIRFKPEATSLFPMLARYDVAPRRNGKSAIHVHTQDLPAIQPATQAEARYVVFLHRSPNALARVVPHAGDAIAALRPTGHGEARAIAEQHAAIERLRQVPAFDFYYSDLDSAVACLQKLAQDGECG
jgi:hypothetical protein